MRGAHRLTCSEREKSHQQIDGGYKKGKSQQESGGLPVEKISQWRVLTPIGRSRKAHRNVRFLTSCYGMPHYGAGSDTALWIPSGKNPIMVRVLTLCYRAVSDTVLWIPSGENPTSVRDSMPCYGTGSDIVLWILSKGSPILVSVSMSHYGAGDRLLILQIYHHILIFMV